MFDSGRLVEEDILTQQVDNNIKNNYIKVTNEQANAKAEISIANDKTIYLSGTEQDIERGIRSSGQDGASTTQGNGAKNGKALQEEITTQAQELPTPDNIVKVTDNEEIISISPDGKEVRLKDLLKDEFDDVKFIETLKNC